MMRMQLNAVRRDAGRIRELSTLFFFSPQGTRKRCGVSVYSVVPFTLPEDSSPLQVASWTPGTGLMLTSPPNFFPLKFLRFPHLPHLRITSEQFPSVRAVMVDDPTAPGGKRLTFTGPMENALQFVSKQMNFTYSYLRAADRTWGTILSNGSWTGMLGLLMREEVEIAAVPFIMTVERNAWMDFTPSLTHFEYKIFAARGRPEVDPWGFLLPMSSLVWAGVVIALLAVIMVMVILPSCLPWLTQHQDSRFINSFNCIRVLLQQDITASAGWWWWERVMLGMWMVMMLVMTRSYAGNLMSLLAVRHIELPYETLRDVLDDPKVAIILVPNQAGITYYRTVESGIYRELGDLLDTKRVTYNRLGEFSRSMDTLVRARTHIIFEVDTIFRTMMAQDFSRTGRCDFYIARSVYLSYSMGMMAQKNSVLNLGLQTGILWSIQDQPAHLIAQNSCGCGWVGCQPAP